MTRTPEAAIAWAGSVTRGYGGLCLKFVRMAYDVPARYGTARAARQASSRWHPTSDPAAVPRGVPVYLGDNHIALALGGGLMRTTNSATNRIHTVAIASWAKGYPLRGWAEDLNGVVVYHGTGPAPSGSSGTLRRGSTGAAVVRLQQTLNLRYPLYSKLVADGVYGPRTEAVVRELQRRAGLVVDGIAGPRTLAYLGLG